MTRNSDEVLVKYVAQGNPKSNDSFRSFLRRYPEHREELIDFTATWRAMAILDRIAPPTPIDPQVEQEMLLYARTHTRVLSRRRSSIGRSC